MKTLQQIYSRVQSNLNDLAFEKVQRAEYVDMAQRVVEDVAMETKVWVAQTTLTPNPSSAPVSPEPVDATIPASAACVRIYYVTREGNEAREYSGQTIDSNRRGNFAFSGNLVNLDRNSFASQMNADESVTLTFRQSFLEDQQVVVSYLSGRPFNLTNWMQLDSTPALLAVPDFLSDAIFWGLLSQAQCLLYNQGDDAIQPRYMMSEQRYRIALARACAKTRNFLDERSPLQAQPFIWLAEEG